MFGALNVLGVSVGVSDPTMARGSPDASTGMPPIVTRRLAGVTRQSSIEDEGEGLAVRLRFRGSEKTLAQPELNRGVRQWDGRGAAPGELRGVDRLVDCPSLGCRLGAGQREAARRLRGGCRADGGHATGNTSPTTRALPIKTRELTGLHSMWRDGGLRVSPQGLHRSQFRQLRQPWRARSAL